MSQAWRCRGCGAITSGTGDENESPPAFSCFTCEARNRVIRECAAFLNDYVAAGRLLTLMRRTYDWEKTSQTTCEIRVHG